MSGNAVRDWFREHPFLASAVSVSAVAVTLFFVKRSRDHRRQSLPVGTQKVETAAAEPSKAPIGMIKMIFLGDAETGKTSLMNRFVKEKFNSQYKPSVGCDFLCKNIMVEDGRTSVTLQIWDTAGQKRFQSLDHVFYKNSDLGIIVFDASKSHETLPHCQTWMEEFYVNTKAPDLPMIIVGNKADKVSQNELDSIKKRVDAMFGERYECFFTSAKDHSGITEMMLRAADVALAHQKQ